MTVEAIALTLGGLQTSERPVKTSADLAELTREGLPVHVLSDLASTFALDRSLVARVAGIAEQTLSRRRRAGARLSSLESDRLVRLARIFTLTVDTLGSREKAAKWLQTANRALGGASPFDTLDTDAGVQAVETVLGRITYGLYS